MTGIYLIAVLVFWFFLSLYIASVFAERFGWNKSRPLTGVLFWVFLLVLPVADEIVGGLQFYYICSKDSELYVDEKNIDGKDMVFVGGWHVISDYATAVEITVYPSTYKDVETGSVLASYRRYHARGGWLVRFLGISENNTPLLFSSGCAPGSEKDFQVKYHSKIVN